MTWSRVLLLDAFSERRVALGANVALLSVLSVRAAWEPVGDPDAWWIAAAGRELLAEAAIPRTNRWSIAHPGDPWVFHEWLLSPVYAVGCARWGSAFVAGLGVLGGCATVAALTFAHRRGGVRDDTAAWTVFAWLLAAQSSAVSPRPGYLLLGLPLLVLGVTRAPRWSPARVVALLALTVLWTNAHGSFPLALALLAAATMRAQGVERTRRAFTLSLCALATLLNPYGADLHRLVARYLAGGDPMAAVLRAEVLEFQPLWRWPAPFANGWVLAACAGVAGLAAHAMLRGSRVARIDAALTLALVTAGALQSRHLVLASLLGFGLLAPHLETLRGARSVWRRPWPLGWLAAPLMCALALLLRSPRDHVSPQVGGRGLAVLSAELGAARAWVPFDASGWFVWNARARGDARLLFDARNDCHRAPAAQDALALERGRGETCEVTRRRGVEVILAPADHPALQGFLRCHGRRAARLVDGWVRAE